MNWILEIRGAKLTGRTDRNRNINHTVVLNSNYNLAIAKFVSAILIDSLIRTHLIKLVYHYC